MNESINIGKGKALSYSTIPMSKCRRNDRVRKLSLANLIMFIYSRVIIEYKTNEK